MDDLKEIVSRNIIYLRTNKKMTQSELGGALSYSDKAVSKWERGESVPDAYVLKEMGSLFDVSVDYLLSEHSEKDLKAAKKRRLDNRNTISLIAFLGVWTLAFIIFSALWLSGTFFWLALVYALPVSLVVVIVLSAVWGKGKINIINISFFVWSVIAAVYLSFLQHNWWFLFIIGLPAQIIILLSSRIMQKR